MIMWFWRCVLFGIALCRFTLITRPQSKWYFNPSWISLWVKVNFTNWFFQLKCVNVVCQTLQIAITDRCIWTRDFNVRKQNYAMWRADRIDKTAIGLSSAKKQHARKHWMLRKMYSYNVWLCKQGSSNESTWWTWIMSGFGKTISGILTTFLNGPNVMNCVRLLSQWFPIDSLRPGDAHMRQ